MTLSQTDTTSLYGRMSSLLGGKVARPDARKAGIAISNEIVALSQAERETVFRQLGSSKDGLDVSEAAARLKSLGPNLIAQEERPSIFRELAGRAKNPLNGLLLSLAFISYLLGDIRAAVVIAVMVVLAIGTAFIQEHRSNQAAANLRAMVKNTASVKRRGGPQNRGSGPSRGVRRNSDRKSRSRRRRSPFGGRYDPGDLRLLDAKDLFLNQATLTGEAMPVGKARRS